MKSINRDLYLNQIIDREKMDQETVTENLPFALTFI